MICFPGCKINLGLKVLNKREDGYHTIESVLYPIEWCDILELIKSEKFIFSSSGLSIPGNSEQNLCVKAYNLIKKDFQISPVHIHLHKIIPMGGGLGGGSSDGAHTLILLNELFELNLSKSELKAYAAKLGSDCPFFIENTPQLATETGTQLENIDINLSGYYIKLLNLGIHISTAEAYGNVQFAKKSESVLKVLTREVVEWNKDLVNSFESSAFKNHPELEQIKNDLYKEGAEFAAMTGSGSTMFALYKEEPKTSFSNAEFEKIIQL